MKKKTRNLSVAFRYNLLLFSVILVLAAALSWLLLDFAADRFKGYELQNTKTAMRLAADDLENQYEILSDVKNRIQITSFYQPSIVRLSAYREIELLEDFVYFKNFSPVLDTYFLIYPDLYPNRMKVFTSEGKTSYFSFYASSHFGLAPEEAKALYHEIVDTRENRILLLGENVLFLFPIRFPETHLPDGRAVIAYAIPRNVIQSRAEAMAAGFPETAEIEICGVRVKTEDAYEACTDVISVRSENGTVTVSTDVCLSKWDILLSSLSAWVFLGAAVCLFAVALVSVILSRAIARPLKNFLNRYASPGERIKNEFIKLEEIVSAMEEENGNSMKLLRARTLLTVLRGYYSESLISRWGFMQLRFDKSCYRVYVLGVEGLSEAAAEACAEEIETLSNDSFCFFAVYIPEDRVISIISGFNSDENDEKAWAALLRYTNGRDAVLCPGGMCDAPERLSVSYMEAVTAFLRNEKWQSENLLDVRTFALQLVTAAERCDEGGMERLIREFISQAGNDYSSGAHVQNLAARLIAELGVLAGERRVEINKHRASMLTLLTSMPVLLNDVCELVKEAFCRQENNASRADQTAQAIVEYVQENAFDPDFDLGRIAELFGLSNDYVSGMIKKLTGSAFKEYLTELRMQRASLLLRDRPEFTVKDISELVGYRKTSNFIKKFKEKFGCTPSQYR